MKSTRRIRRRKQTRRKRKGGRVLGEGANAKVVSPAIPCEGKDTNGYVSKVFENKEYFDDAKSHITGPVLAKLKEIDPNQDFFLYPEFCDTPGSLTDENKADKITDANKTYSYLLKKAERSLEQEFDEKTKEIQKDADKAIEYLRPIVAQVFVLLEKLHENNIIHRDFHMGNVVRMADGSLRIIDFDTAKVLPDDMKKSRADGLKENDRGDFVQTSAVRILFPYHPDNTPKVQKIVYALYT